MIASTVQVVGALGVAVGVGLIFPPAGIIIAGLLAIAFGISLEKK